MDSCVDCLGVSGAYTFRDFVPHSSHTGFDAVLHVRAGYRKHRILGIDDTLWNYRCRNIDIIDVDRIRTCAHIHEIPFADISAEVVSKCEYTSL